MKKDLMRASEIVNEFPISMSSIWRYVKIGTLEAIKVTGGVTVFKRKDIEAFFNGEKEKQDKSDLISEIEKRYLIK